MLSFVRKLTKFVVSQSRSYSSENTSDQEPGPITSKHKEALKRCKEIESQSTLAFISYVRDPKTGGGKKLKQSIPYVRKAVQYEDENNPRDSSIDGEFGRNPKS